MPAPITGATLLSGAADTDSLAASFAAGDTITVNGTPITFVASGATGNQLNVTDSVQTLLTKIDFDHRHLDPVDHQRRRDHAAHRQRREPDGHEFERGRVRGARLQRAPRRRPCRRCGSAARRSAPRRRWSTARANTVAWYTGNSGPGSARRIVDRAGRSVDDGAVRRAGQRTGDPLAAAVDRGVRRRHDVADRNQFGRAGPALSQRIAQNLTPQPGQQTIQDIQTDFADRAERR